MGVIKTYKSEFDIVKETYEYIKTWTSGINIKVNRKETDEYVDVLIDELEYVIKLLNSIKHKDYADEVIDTLLLVDDRLFSIRHQVEWFAVRIFRKSTSPAYKSEKVL